MIQILSSQVITRGERGSRKRVFALKITVALSQGLTIATG